MWKVTDVDYCVLDGEGGTEGHVCLSLTSMEGLSKRVALELGCALTY